MFSQLLSADQFMPHGVCLLWFPELLALHAGADALIALSYYSIPAALGYFVLRRRGVLFPWVFVLFAAFILACGTTHLLGIWTLWQPVYLLEGAVKLVTAAVSVAAAIAVWRLMPDLLAMPSTAQLAAANRELAAHRAAEARTERLAEELEQRVAARTRELSAEVESRRRAEAELKEISERFRYMFMNNPLPMWVYDRHTLAYLEVNDAAVAVYGYTREEFLGMRLVDVRPPEDVAHLLTVLASPRASSREAPGWRHRRKDGSLLHVDLFVHQITFEGQPAGLVTAIDVTARRAIEDQLRQAQKMEVVGQLTGGVAHDFNNLLTVVLGNAQLLETMSEGQLEQQELCQEIVASARRGADLTQRLLAFARRQKLSPAAIDVTRLVFEMRALLTRAVGEAVKVDVRCEAEIWHAFADGAQLESALLNLVVNARDAMPNGGRIVIELRNETRNATPDRGSPDPKAGDYVSIAVVDDGEGMTPEVLSRVFEPFFTTKATGRGSGLGLSMVYGFAQQSGGGVALASRPGQGTTATLLLPRAPVRALAEALPTRVPAAPQTGQETVLVVEDETLVRQLVRRELERLGYRVLLASDGPSALALLQAAGAIDLLFVDIIMPGGMNGVQVAAAAQALRPRLRVLLTSGYPDTVLEHGSAEETYGKLLPKPYQLAELAGAIRSKLDAAA